MLALDVRRLPDRGDLIIVIGRLALLGRAVPDRPFSLFVVLVLGTASFAALGLGITALVRSAEGSSAVINAVYLPMAIISGTFFTPEAYPASCTRSPRCCR